MVIIGGGFGGVAAARAFKRQRVKVTLVDRNVYKTFQPLLYQVATAGLNPGDVTMFLRGLRLGQRNLRFRHAEMQTIHPQENRVEFADGTSLGYDFLIVTTGVTTNYMGVPGAEQHSMAMYTRTQAMAIRDHIFSGLEQMARRNGRLQCNVVVVGGGATGVEVAGALADLARGELRAVYPELEDDAFNIMIVQRGDEVLKPFSEKLRAFSAKALTDRGVQLRFGAGVETVTETGVTLTDGTEIRSDLTVWAAGVTAPEHVKNWNLPQGQGGRILVTGTQQVEGHANIFAAGDICGTAKDALPQLAQVAIQGGRHAAAQVLKLIAGDTELEPFAYHDKGIMATIGRRAAVAELPNGIMLKGTIGWLAWLAVHVMTLIGHRNRRAVFMNLFSLYVGMKGTHQSNPIVGEVSLPAHKRARLHDQD
ncbi:FAD-dependent oxidoreductase [Micrococcales bacterium 31B]|nr:FAD-dependent oxidoreductase [Micrococcales bacterium 31B]